MPNIKDVARLAKVSVATVSRVLNNESNVKSETKERVMDVINQLGYRPNMIGRSLRRSQTEKVLVLLNTISNQFYSKVVRGIEEKAFELGYSVMICMTHGNKEIEQRYINMLATKLFDGVIFLTTEHEGEYLNEALRGVAVVQACEPKEAFDTPIVCIDNEQAAFDAVSFLIESGHQNIAFFGAGNVYLSSIERQNGYLRALEKHNIKVNNEWIFNEGFGFSAGKRAAKSMMNSKNIPTAVFAISDSCAVGGIKYLQSVGIEAPNDISVMGFDNTVISQIYNPSLTTVQQPQVEIGEKAMELLAEKIKSNCKGKNKKIVLNHSIVVRESTKST